MLVNVIFYSAITVIATGLGALPFFKWRTVSTTWLALGTCVAAGFMLGASGLLLVKGTERDVSGTLWGVVAGAILIAILQYILNARPDLHIEHATHADARKMLLIVGVMTLHSFAEGIGMGVAFSESAAFGILIIIAMTIQNIPEGLAISVILVPRGVSPLNAFGWSVFSSIPQVIMAVPAFLFVERFTAFLAPGLGFAAGAMIWMCIVELLPDAKKDLKPLPMWGTTVIASVAMLLLERIFS